MWVSLLCKIVSVISQVKFQNLHGESVVDSIIRIPCLSCITDCGQILHWALRAIGPGQRGVLGSTLHVVAPTFSGASLCQAPENPLAREASCQLGTGYWIHLGCARLETRCFNKHTPPHLLVRVKCQKMNTHWWCKKMFGLLVKYLISCYANYELL